MILTMECLAMTARLALGSAQFGSAYGISNTRGRVSEEEVRHILAFAAQSQIKTLDIAPYDGDVERLAGRCWPFPSPFKPQIRTLRLDKGVDWLEQRLRRSIDHMGLARVQTALVDCAEDLLHEEGDRLWARLEKLKSEGLIASIGFSAQYEDQPVLLAKRFKPDVVQVQASILDQRLEKRGDLEALADMGIEVQVRQVFMQGLIFLPREALPPALAPLGPHLSRIKRMMMEAGTDPLHAALSYGLHLKGVAKVVVGVTSVSELRAILAASERPLPALAFGAMASDDPIALDSRLWHGDVSGLRRAQIKVAQIKVA